MKDETRHDATTAASRRSIILAAMVRGATKVDAAAAAGCGLKTVDLVADDPAFRDELAAERSRIYADAMAGLKAATTDAVATLSAAMRSRNEGAKIRAAGMVLSFAFKWHETADLEERIARLEQIASEVRVGHGRPVF